MIIRGIMVSVAVSACCALTFADETTKSELQKLVDALSGHWTIAQTNEDGTTAQGEEAWYVAPGGTPLIEEYHVTNSRGKNLADYATIWWDDNVKQYHGIWCADFTDEGCTPFTVQWSGSKVEMRGKYSVHGKPFSWREIFELTSRNSFIQTLDIAPERGELKLHGTVHGTRAPAAPTLHATP